MFYRVTGSHDCTIRVWDLGSFTCITTIDAHQGEAYVGIQDIPFSVLAISGPITCLDYNGRMLVTGSSDKYVYIELYVRNKMKMTKVGL